MKDCPKCGAPVDGQWCKACGEGKPDKSNVGADADMYDWQCADRDRFGFRCVKQGTRSPTTMNRGPSGKGQNGPWYCRDHDPQTRGMIASRTAPPQGFQTLKNVLMRPANVGDPEADAERAAIQGEVALVIEP